MSKLKLSPWFSHSKEDKPVNVGVYQTRFVLPSGNIFDGWSLWDGGRWMNTRPTKKNAASELGEGHQKKLWRGIVK